MSSDLTSPESEIAVFPVFETGCSNPAPATCPLGTTTRIETQTPEIPGFLRFWRVQTHPGSVYFFGARADGNGEDSTETVFRCSGRYFNGCSRTQLIMKIRIASGEPGRESWARVWAYPVFPSANVGIIAISPPAKTLAISIPLLRPDMMESARPIATPPQIPSD
jgi:hypothetical protein